MNTMADLRREVAQRLRENLHGRTFDEYDEDMPETPHMLGVVPIGVTSTERAEEGTLLDPEYSLWKNYYEEITTTGGVRREVETAIQSLFDDGIIRMRETPEDSGIHYVTVDRFGGTGNEVPTECADCGNRITTSPELELMGGRYFMMFELSCECGFGRRLRRTLERL